MTIKAIETQYKGYRFRSRLEARWAVAFDAMGLKWEYEPEGFETELQGQKFQYLPDFKIYKTLRSNECYWAEVKGSNEQLRAEFEKNKVMHDFGGILPDYYQSYDTGKTGLILLGPIPEFGDSGSILFPMLQHNKGISKVWCVFNHYSTGTVTKASSGSIAERLALVGEVHNLECDINYWDLSPSWLPLTVRDTSVNRALVAARSARFEHGESGAC